MHTLIKASSKSTTNYSNLTLGDTSWIVINSCIAYHEWILKDQATSWKNQEKTILFLGDEIMTHSAPSKCIMLLENGLSVVTNTRSSLLPAIFNLCPGAQVWFSLGGKKQSFSFFHSVYIFIVGLPIFPFLSLWEHHLVPETQKKMCITLWVTKGIRDLFQFLCDITSFLELKFCQ